MAQSGKIIRPVRVHQRVDHRQFIAGLMMINHDHRHAQPSGFGQWLETGRAAIHRHQQRGALFREHPHRFDVGAIAFEDAVGNVNQRIEPAMAQVPCQQCRRGSTIDIVIAEDRNLFAAHRRFRDALRRGFHLRHGIGIGHQLADGRIEKIVHRVDLDIAPGQHPRQHFRQMVALRNRQRSRRPARIEPVAPQLSRRGLRHAEKGWRCFDRQCGCKERHDAFSR